MDRSKFDLAIIPWPHVSAGDTREAVQRLRAARSIDRKLVVMPGGYGYYFFRDWMIRSGDFRSVLVHATAREDSVVHAPVTIVCTGTYWRNSWKYQARTYRHFGWDNGTIMANMLAICTASMLPSRIVCGFIDSEVNALLDLDPTREAASSMVSIGFANEAVSAATPAVPRLNLPVTRLSRSEVDYP